MALSLFAETLLNKWLPTRSRLPDTFVDMTGRTVIITGSNTGLGLEAAKSFYAMNPERLILAVRSINKGEDAKRAIQGDKGNTEGRPKIEVWQIDMASFDSVKAFANRCNTELKRLDVFLANAAISTLSWSTTPDGWETSLQVNVLSTFLLALLVAPALERTAKLPPPVAAVSLKPHLTIVASDVHFMATLRTKNQPNIIAALNAKDQYVATGRYSDTKLLDVLLTRQLAQLPQFDQEKSGIVLCTVNPGFCRSELMREVPSVFRSILYAIFARTTKEGARTYIWASLSDGIPQGAYSSSCKVEQPSRLVRSDEGKQIQQRLWNELGDIIRPVAPELAPYWAQA